MGISVNNQFVSILHPMPAMVVKKSNVVRRSIRSIIFEVNNISFPKISIFDVIWNNFSVIVIPTHTPIMFIAINAPPCANNTGAIVTITIVFIRVLVAGHYHCGCYKA